MKVNPTPAAGVVEIMPDIHEDNRGYFIESYSEKELKKYGLNTHFVQDNQSFSKKGVLRGLHFQKAPFGQGKLIRVIDGCIQDVIVDLRKDSPDFGRSYSFILDSKKKNMLFIPEKFAHGFVALEDTVLAYKCTSAYNKEFESGIIWNDPDLCIEWKIPEPIISQKDLSLKTLNEIKNEL